MSCRKNNKLTMIAKILILYCVIGVIIAKNLVDSNLDEMVEKKKFVNLFKKSILNENSKNLLIKSFLETYQLLKDPQLTYFQRFKITQYLQKITQELKKYINGKEEDFYAEILARGYQPTREKFDYGERQPFKWGR